MKILILFGPDQFGGSFVIAEQIARRLKQQGYEVLLVLNDPLMVKVYTELGYDVRTIPTMIRRIHPLKDIQTIFELNKLYKEQNCSMIHSHTSKSGVYARVLKLFKPKIKVMHTVHGYYFPKGNFSGALFKCIERVLLMFCDGIAFVNQEDYKRAIKWHKHPRAKVIYNGVEILEDLESIVVPQLPLKIAISARLVWEKGFKDVIELVNRLNPSEYEFHIMGEGPDGVAIKSALSTNTNVTFYGQISYVQKILKTCHVNLLPSYREGLSLSILEAMSVGIPTIAYDIRGNRELIENGKQGILVPLGDVEGLRIALECYLENTTLRVQQGNAAREEIKQQYGLDLMLNNYNEMINEILCKTNQQ